MSEQVRTEFTEKTVQVYLTKEEIEQIVAKGISDAFRDLGLGAGKSGSFEEAKAIRADLQFLRDWRELCELVRHKGITSAIGIIVMAFAVVVALGVKQWLWQ